MLTRNMKLIWQPSVELWHILAVYIMCPYDLDLLTLESCHVIRLAWSTPVPSLNWIRLTVQELGRLKCSIGCQLKFPMFPFCGGNESQISNFSFLTPKALPWAERRIMTYWGCVQRCDLWSWQSNKKNDKNFHASNWLFAQTTHFDVAPWSFARGVKS